MGEHDLGSHHRGSILKSGWECVAWEWRWTMPRYWWSRIIGSLLFHSWWQCRLWRTGVWIQGTTGDSHYSAPFWFRHNLALRSDTLLNRMLAIGRGVRYPIWFNSMFEFWQKTIHSIFDLILLYPRFNSKYYSIQKIIQFNSQGLFDTGRIGKVPENCPKSVQK